MRSVEQAKRTELPPITRAERSEYVPLSFAQQRLWFLAQMKGVSEAYHIPTGNAVEGEAGSVALRRALDRIVWRHEALRTRFAYVEEQAVQRIEARKRAGLLWWRNSWAEQREWKRDGEEREEADGIGSWNGGCERRQPGGSI